VEPGIHALEAGKHLLMQKPLCGDLKEANRFVAAAEKTDRIVFALPHFAPSIYAIRRQIAEGKIGKLSGAYCRTSHGGPEVYYAEVRDNFQEKSDDLWFFDAKRAAVGALFDMGVYAVSALVSIMGSAVSVTGRTATVAKPTTLEDTATLIMEFENGALGTAETGWCDPARTWLLSIHGTTGKLTSPGADGHPLTFWEPGSYTREDIPAVPHPVDVSAADLGNPHEYFLRCVQEGAQPAVSNAYLARHVTEILLAGLRSAGTDKTVKIQSRSREL
jgi:predicted dehydrogenase